MTREQEVNLQFDFILFSGILTSEYLHIEMLIILSRVFSFIILGHETEFSKFPFK